MMICTLVLFLVHAHDGSTAQSCDLKTKVSSRVSTALARVTSVSKGLGLGLETRR